MKTKIILEFSLEAPIEDIADKISNRISTMQGVDNMKPITATLVENDSSAHKTEKASAWNSEAATVARKVLCD